MASVQVREDAGEWEAAAYRLSRGVTKGGWGRSDVHPSGDQGKMCAIRDDRDVRAARGTVGVRTGWLAGCYAPWITFVVVVDRKKLRKYGPILRDLASDHHLLPGFEHISVLTLLHGRIYASLSHSPFRRSYAGGPLGLSCGSTKYASPVALSVPRSRARHCSCFLPLRMGYAAVDECSSLSPPTILTRSSPLACESRWGVVIMSIAENVCVPPTTSLAMSEGRRRDSQCRL